MLLFVLIPLAVLGGLHVGWEWVNLRSLLDVLSLSLSLCVHLSTTGFRSWCDIITSICPFCSVCHYSSPWPIISLHPFMIPALFHGRMPMKRWKRRKKITFKWICMHCSFVSSGKETHAIPSLLKARRLFPLGTTSNYNTSEEWIVCIWLLS